ncbi:MAG: hypothetical protein A2Y62_08795 [Candidatus Fischerbacteria bacterium RBG_13_37_8]|uniref:Tetratricopeptide repeat protein n=1 Tax=Candidatus Fischerbacteria bacterium RBG_13_37_8 TaxID=1817863 RepID=A0A1F5V820_9BACT|nr:MAG: hypothetical protein A2Y62_08795 [Candidatus Fischerbacteria bacterium RBG_13_37_8]
MKFKIFFASLLILFSVMSSYAQLKMELIPIEKVWLLGEPVYFAKAHLKNESNKILKTYYPLNYWDGTPMKLIIEPREGYVPLEPKQIDFTKLIFEYEPNWEMNVILWADIIKTGMYKAKIVYDATAISQISYVPDALIGPIESNEVTFKVKEPVGIDKIAYDAFKKSKRNIATIGGMPHIMLEKYPTSIYAGWALRNYEPTLNLEFHAELLFQDAELIQKKDIKINLNSCHYVIDINAKTKEKKIRFCDEIASSYINKASIFLKARSDFYYSNLLWTKLGVAYALLNRWQEAKEAFEKALSFPWDPLKLNNIELNTSRKNEVIKAVDLITKNKLAK